MPWSREERLVYERAFRAAHNKIRTARPPTEAEMLAELSPCEQRALGFEPDGLEELEELLVPCGC